MDFFEKDKILYDEFERFKKDPKSFTPQTGPKIVQLDLTNACNLHCVGCWCHSYLLEEKMMKPSIIKKNIDLNSAKRIINDLSKLGVSKIILSGAGEPFMHKDIIPIIKHIKRKGISLEIITNFTLITKEIAEILVKEKVDHITASIWAGDQKGYEKVHDIKESILFERIKNNLIYIHSIKKKDNLPRIKTYNVISSYNFKDIKQMTDFALSSLVDELEFQLIDIYPGKTDSLMLNKNQAEKTLSQLRRLSKRKDYIGVKTSDDLKLDKQNLSELEEYGRFIKRSIIPKGFKVYMDDPKSYHIICPNGKANTPEVIEDNKKTNSFSFKFDKEVCISCKNATVCPVVKNNFWFKLEFLSLLGYGSFYRRIKSIIKENSKETKENSNNRRNSLEISNDRKESLQKYDYVVDKIPCYAGFMYSRILASGEVIPCCKAVNLPMGNINDKSFAEIWKNKKYQEFRSHANSKKDDPYFAPVNCYKSCDNLGMNLEMHRSFAKIKDKDMINHLKITDNPKNDKKEQ